MQGRKPKGVFVLVEDDSSESSAALNAWYASTRIPEATASGVFSNATRYANANANAKGGAKEPGYLTVFETDADDPAAEWSKLDLGDDHAGLAPIMSAGFTVTGTLPDPSPGATKGLLVGVTDCPEPARRTEYDDWYDNVHAADVVRSRLYFAACRFERTGGDMPQFLALYETEGEEPSTFQNYLARPERDKTMTDAAAVRHVWTFNLIHSQAGS